MYFMSNTYPKTTNLEKQRNDLIARRSREIRKQERRDRLARTLSVVAVGALSGAVLLGIHNRDADITSQHAEAEQAKTVVVGVSSETTNLKAKAGDTLSSMVRDYSDVVNDDPENVQDYVAFQYAVKEVETLPENHDALADNTLQIGERIVIPTEITVTTEAQINQGK